MSTSDRVSEDLSEANRYLLKIKVDTTNSFQIYSDFLDSLSTKNYAINLYKLKTGASASPVQVRMYDNTGGFIYGWSQCFGDINRFGILDSLPFKEVNRLPVNRKLTFSNDISLYNSSGDLSSLAQDFDYIIAVYWSQWSGWYGKDALKRVKSYIEKYPNKRFLFIKINTSP